MIQKKYQVFISSTFRDLQEERQDAIRNVLDMGHIPAGMELFPAPDTRQMEYIEKIIDECDYYVLIIGGRYGSLDKDGVGFTQKEYTYALSSGKTVLAFVHGDLGSVPVSKADTDSDRARKLIEFRNVVMSGRLVREWTTRENLETLVIKGLMHAFNTHPAVGWMRADAAASEDLLRQINELRIENERLKAKIDVGIPRDHLEIDNLAAGLDEVFRIELSWTRDSDDYVGKQHQPMAWRDIIKVVGPRFRSPSSLLEIDRGIEDHFNDPTSSHIKHDLYRSSRDTIAIQLEALGVIEPFEEDNGLIKYRLSLAGRRILMEISTVRSG